MTNTAYDPRALWMKARLFLNHALDDPHLRSFDERAMWASLALELLGKGALAKTSPTLIASPSEDGVNVLAASGLVAATSDFKSIAAAALFSRCAKAFRPFSDSEAKKVARARNDYLHGGNPEFSPVPEAAWWPKYWALAVVLVHAQDEELSDLVGPDRVEMVEAHLAKNRKNIEDRVEMLVERSKQRLALFEAGTMPAATALEWERSKPSGVGLPHREITSCPACDELGWLEGEEVESFEWHHEMLSAEDYDMTVELQVSAEYFSCPNCHLVLDGYEVIGAAALPVSFSAEGDPADYADDDYGND